ncbi:MAG: hypothetical protein HYV29_01820 [Ignavibacteriales bacterium]|nr:hypothetical protein [Ignavibacteriales bacterium]
MTLQEKNLYQQIHPARLITDWAAGIAACYLFWQNDIWLGVAISFVPSLIVSLLVIRFADLEKIRQSTFGDYFKRTYSKRVDLIRFAGFVVTAGASWWQNIPGVAAGIVIIIATWTYGLMIKK